MASNGSTARPAASAAAPKLSSGQRRWLEHLRAWERSGESMKAYAARRGLSAQAFYQAATRLRAKGAAERRAASRPPQRAVSFVEVGRASLRPEADWSWRVRLPGGAAFESRVPLEAEALGALLDRLAGRR